MRTKRIAAKPKQTGKDHIAKPADFHHRLGIMTVIVETATAIVKEIGTEVVIVIGAFLGIVEIAVSEKMKEIDSTIVALTLEPVATNWITEAVIPIPLHVV